LPNLPVNTPSAFYPSTESPEGTLTLDSEADAPYTYIYSDLTYATHEGVALKLRLILPNTVKKPPLGFPDFAQTTPRPLVIYVQGSAWKKQDLDISIPMLLRFSEETGYAVASVEYRPSTTAKAPAQLQDVKAAIRFMRSKAEKYNIDAHRIGILGDSSGGHLSALIGTPLNTFI